MEEVEKILFALDDAVEQFYEKNLKNRLRKEDFKKVCIYFKHSGLCDCKEVKNGAVEQGDTGRT